MDRYVFQCSNCSKAFRKSEYLENHIQRRHVNKSLAENGLFPLIEQIKRYKSGLFVESSSIDDLKAEIRNLQTCLKETSEDLIKEKIAREQLQRIIESEIIEKLNSLQETWSVEPARAADHQKEGEVRDESSENGESDSNGEPVDQQPEQRCHDEGERDGNEDVGAEPQARQHGHIGADHDHLAMRHVDDAHRAISNGEAERDQQQDRSQAETDEQNLEHDSASRHPPREGGARWMRFPKRQVFSLAASRPFPVQKRFVGVSP